MDIPPWGWIVFGITVVALLAIDHFAHRGERAKSRKVALTWTIVWIAAGVVFNLFVWAAAGAHAAGEYLAVYLIEKSLSTDNMFLFLIIFDMFNIPREQQHKALFWGIVGAVAFRGVMIFLGARALERWEWMTYIFGAIVLFAAYRALRKKPGKSEKSPLLGWVANKFPVTKSAQGGRFIAREDGRRAATPLLLALAAIELTDVMMAIDSVAVAFSMSRNAFVIYSANVFAILGLRALYLLLAHTIAELPYLHYGLALVLAFAGIKLIADPIVHVPPAVSVSFTVIVIGTSVWAGLRKRRAERSWAGLTK